VKLNLEIFRLAGAALGHANTRQGLIAQNIANADTPDYAARDLRPFKETFNRISSSNMAMRATRPGHIGRAEDEIKPDVFDVEVSEVKAPNGNTVSLEDQLMRSAQVKSQHELALGIYQKSLKILRTSIARQ